MEDHLDQQLQCCDDAIEGLVHGLAQLQEQFPPEIDVKFLAWIRLTKDLINNDWSASVLTNVLNGNYEKDINFYAQPTWERNQLCLDSDLHSGNS